MLPHLADRPLNLQRFPNGAGAPGFWQKDIPATAPTWLTRWHETGVDGREDRGANDHLIADRAATLCWLGNQASFEIHAWTGRLPEPWRPTFALIDIDPGDEDDLGGDARPRAALPDRARAPRRPRLPQDDRQARHPGLDPDRRRATTFAETSAWVEKRLARGRRDRARTSSPGSGRRTRARAAPGSTTPRTRAIKTLVAPYAVRPRAGRARLRADHLGRAGRPGPAPGPLDDPDDRRARRASVGDLFAAAQTDAQELPKV